MNKIMKELRLGNLQLRKAHSIYNGEEYFEFVKWYPNDLYGKEGDFEWDEKRELYHSKTLSNLYCDKSCFKDPESCYTLSIVEFNSDGEPDIKTVGSRTVELSDDEFIKYKLLVEYFFEEYKKAKEE